MPGMRVLGLDPGSRRTGFGVVERQGYRLRCVEHGCVAPPAGMPLPQRLYHIAREVGVVMDRVAPDAWWSRRPSSARTCARRWCSGTCAAR